jgi:hypothetical protein
MPPSALQLLPPARRPPPALVLIAALSGRQPNHSHLKRTRIVIQLSSSRGWQAAFSIPEADSAEFISVHCELNTQHNRGCLPHKLGVGDSLRLA